MIIAVVACVLGLVAVVVALVRDVALDTAEPSPPDWGLLPEPADIARVELPLAVPGYDPATVEVTLGALAQAYGDLLAVAPPEVVARAHRRAAQRQGTPSKAENEQDAAEGTGLPSALGVGVPPRDRTREALQAEAALARLAARGGDGMLGRSTRGSW